MAREFARSDYTVGWISALPIELAAARKILDEEHKKLPQSHGDTNSYRYGNIGEHNVVLASLPAGQTGTNSAAAVAMQMKTSFPSIRFGLMVGIGGGVPSTQDDIRLGDIVVSTPHNDHGGVIQYDRGKTTPDKIERTGFLNAPPQILLAAVGDLQSDHILGMDKLSEYITTLNAVEAFARPEADSDILFDPEYNHIAGFDCSSCDKTRQVPGRQRKSKSIAVHYGTIASGNQVMRHAKERDAISSEFNGVLCFEMEAAGLMNNFPCLVIRGICDYADSHKNKRWQPFAAAVAAAYAKDLLMNIPADEVLKEKTIEKATRPSCFHLPFDRNLKFVGRESYLEELDRKLFVEKDSRMAVVVGLGGIGKTQVALNFAYFVKEKYPSHSIFWVPALSNEAFKNAFEEIAKVSGTDFSLENKDDVVQTVRRYLNGPDAGKWLLIVDNADDYELLHGRGSNRGLLQCLPRSELGLTLFTTRSREVAQSLVRSDIIEVGKMDQKEATALLEGALCPEVKTNDSGAVTALLDELDNLPLAITQAAGYVNTNVTPVSEYVNILASTEEDMVYLMSSEFPDSTRYPKAANAIAKTWITSFEQIRKNERVGYLAVVLLVFISYIEWKAIPLSILPTWSSRAELNTIIGILRSYSFIEKRPNVDTIDMHRLVHLACRVWHKQNPAHAKMPGQVMKHLTEICPWDPDIRFARRQELREYVPHLMRVLKDTEGQDIDERVGLCRQAGRFMVEDGKWVEAIHWLQYACKETSLAKQNHRVRAESLTMLAAAYRAMGKTSSAFELLDNALHLSDSAPEDQQQQILLMRDQADLYRADGQTVKAISQLRRVIKMEKTSIGRHFDSIWLRLQHANAGQSLFQTSRASEIVNHGVAVSIVQNEIIGLLSSQKDLGQAYFDGGQIADAVVLLEHVVMMQKIFLAGNKAVRREAEHALARAYAGNGQIPVAIAMLERALKDGKAWPEDDIFQVGTKAELAMLYYATGRFEESIPLLDNAIRRQEQMSPGNPKLVDAKRLLAEMREAQKVPGVGS